MTNWTRFLNQFSTNNIRILRYLGGHMGCDQERKTARKCWYWCSGFLLQFTERQREQMSSCLTFFESNENERELSHRRFSVMLRGCRHFSQERGRFMYLGYMNERHLKCYSVGGARQKRFLRFTICRSLPGMLHTVVKSSRVHISKMSWEWLIGKLHERGIWWAQSSIVLSIGQARLMKIEWPLQNNVCCNQPDHFMSFTLLYYMYYNFSAWKIMLKFVTRFCCPLSEWVERDFTLHFGT